MPKHVKLTNVTHEEPITKTKKQTKKNCALMLARICRFREGRFTQTAKRSAHHVKYKMGRILTGRRRKTGDAHPANMSVKNYL